MATTQQKGLASQIFFFVLGPALCFLLKDIEPLEGMTPEGMRCLAGCVWLLVWWMSELLPMPATSLMSIPIFAFLGVLPAAKVFAAIGTPSCMLLFGATIIIGLLKESNFIERYAYWCLNLPFIRGSVTRFLLVFTMSAGLLSAIAPNIPLAVLFVSIAVTIGRSCMLPPSNGMMRSLTVLSAVAPAVGGAGTPLGGAPNIVVIGLIAATLRHETTFWEWTALGMPLTVLTLLAMFALCWLIFPLRGEASRMPMSEDFLRARLKELGPVTRHEHIAMGRHGHGPLPVVRRPQLAGAAGWTAGEKLLSAPFVAVLMGLATFLIPLRRNEQSGKFEFSHDSGAGHPQYFLAHSSHHGRHHHLRQCVAARRRGQVGRRPDPVRAGRSFRRLGMAGHGAAYRSGFPGGQQSCSCGPDAAHHRQPGLCIRLSPSGPPAFPSGSPATWRSCSPFPLSPARRP